MDFLRRHIIKLEIASLAFLMFIVTTTIFLIILFLALGSDFFITSVLSLFYINFGGLNQNLFSLDQNFLVLAINIAFYGFFLSLAIFGFFFYRKRRKEIILHISLLLACTLHLLIFMFIYSQALAIASI
jgi:hypothetical protein